MKVRQESCMLSSGASTTRQKMENGIISYFGAMKLTCCGKLSNGKKSNLEDLEQREKGMEN